MCFFCHARLPKPRIYPHDGLGFFTDSQQTKVPAQSTHTAVTTTPGIPYNISLIRTLVQNCTFTYIKTRMHLWNRHLMNLFVPLRGAVEEAGGGLSSLPVFKGFGTAAEGLVWEGWLTWTRT